MKPFVTNSVFLKYKVLQGNNNACSAIALAQIIYIEMEKQNLNSFFPSILFMYYNARIHKNLDEGVFIENLLQSTMEFGSAPDTMWQYYKEDPLEKPPQECYEFGKQFPISISFEKYNNSEHVQEFIGRQLWNDKIILCDIKNPGTNMDHTILILGIDEKDYICLDSIKDDSLQRVSLSVLNSQLDRKDIYAISCSFERKCLLEMTEENTEFEFYKNVQENRQCPMPNSHDLIEYGTILGKFWALTKNRTMRSSIRCCPRARTATVATRWRNRSGTSVSVAKG